MLLYILIFLASLAVLILGSNWFVESSEKIGLSWGVSPFIIGVTIVAFGTSLPELATSIVSVLSNNSEIVIGNVIGSNITNILLILGVTAVVGKEIVLDFDVMNVDMPLLFCSAFLFYFALSDLHLSGLEISLFFVALIVFLLNSIHGEKEDKSDRVSAGAKSYGLLILGGVLVYFGAIYTISAIEQISHMAGISPEIIALGAVALGTSLPELVVSLTAIKRGNHAIAVGNVLGSNIFNTYAVMGIPALFGDLVIPSNTLTVFVPIMMAATILFGVFCLSKKISRWEGCMMLVFYAYFINELFKTSLAT